MSQISLVTGFFEGMRKNILYIFWALVPSDWENRTQGLWVSPKCPASPEGQTPKDSVTGFKASLLRYLMAYQVSQLHSYMDVIKSADFSSINAFFIGSSPGSHQGSALSDFGHMAARSVFRQGGLQNGGNTGF